jgi:hypothetical protein
MIGANHWPGGFGLHEGGLWRAWLSLRGGWEHRDGLPDSLKATGDGRGEWEGY